MIAEEKYIQKKMNETKGKRKKLFPARRKIIYTSALTFCNYRPIKWEFRNGRSLQHSDIFIIGVKLSYKLYRHYFFVFDLGSNDRKRGISLSPFIRVVAKSIRLRKKPGMSIPFFSLSLFCVYLAVWRSSNWFLDKA